MEFRKAHNKNSIVLISEHDNITSDLLSDIHITDNELSNDNKNELINKQNSNNLEIDKRLILNDNCKVIGNELTFKDLHNVVSDMESNIESKNSKNQYKFSENEEEN